MKVKLLVLAVATLVLSILPVHVNLQSPSSVSGILVTNLGYAGGGVNEPPPMGSPPDTSGSSSSVIYPTYPEKTNALQSANVNQTSDYSLLDSFVGVLIDTYLLAISL